MNIWQGSKNSARLSQDLLHQNVLPFPFHFTSYQEVGQLIVSVANKGEEKGIDFRLAELNGILKVIYHGDA